MTRIVRRLYKSGYHYVALDDNNKRVAWKRIKGNKNAKQQVVQRSKELIFVKPKIEKFKNVSKVSYNILDKEEKRVRQKTPFALKKRPFYVTVTADVYYKGKKIKEFTASSTKSTYSQRNIAEEEAINSATRQGVRQRGDIENYPNKIPPRGYTAKIKKIEYSYFKGNK